MTPLIEADRVLCECGAVMRPFNYVLYPGSYRMVIYKCLADDSHICLPPSVKTV